MQMIYICANITNFSINWLSTFSIWITNEKKSIILLFIQQRYCEIYKKRIDDKIEGYKKNLDAIYFP